MPTYKQLCLTHPEYDADQWARLRLLYSGVNIRKALQASNRSDRHLCEQLFPMHNAEEDRVYKERLARLMYVPYFGQIVDHLVSSLTTDPIRMEVADGGTADPFYDLFATDVSPSGHTRRSLNQLLREQILTALVGGCAWTLVDLPPEQDAVEGSDDYAATPAASLADQEFQGMLRAYAVPLDPVSIVDWERQGDGDEDDDLAWVLIRCSNRKRPDLNSDRSMCREEWMWYSPEEWVKYAIEYDVDKGRPNPDDEVPEVARGRHSFGRVPVLQLRLPEGLWAGGKIESMAIEHLNKYNALCWGQYKSLFQFLVVKLAPLDPLSPVTEDANRGVNQRVGQGRILQLGDKDAIDYISPDSAPFEVALKSLNSLRDEMFRVLHSMAQSVDNSGAALQRSGASKQVDQASTTVVLRALGQIMREHAEAIYETVQIGRQDPLANWHAVGFDEYQDASLDQLVAEAVQLESVSIPSATFQVSYKLKLAALALGDVSEEKMKKIEAEMEANISNEMFQPPVLTAEPAPGGSSGDKAGSSPQGKQPAISPPSKEDKKAA